MNSSSSLNQSLSSTSTLEPGSLSSDSSCEITKAKIADSQSAAAQVLSRATSGLQRSPTSALEMGGVTQTSPWNYKLKGYPHFSEWMASSPELLMIRRFGVLNARILLMMQDDILVKGNELIQMDEAAKNGTGEYARSDTMRRGLDKERKDKLREIKDALKEYNEYIATYSEIRARSSTTDDQLQHLKNYFGSHKKSIKEDEQAYLNQDADMICVVPKTRAPVRRLLERVFIRIMSRVFRAKPRPGRQEFVGVTHLKDSALEWFVTFVVLLTGVSLLVGPIWWLAFVEENVTRLAIITGFIIIFAILGSVSVFARPFDVLGATAAYSAVLMVFLQLNQSSSSTT